MIFKSTSDAFSFTEYNSNCLVNKKIMKENKIKSQYEYRKFLQENAEKIMENDRNQLRVALKK